MACASYACVNCILSGALYVLCIHAGEKLRTLLLQHGSWDRVEMTLKQWTESRNKNQKRGGYVTKQWLIDNRSFTKCFCLHLHSCICCRITCMYYILPHIPDIKADGLTPPSNGRKQTGNFGYLTFTRLKKRISRMTTCGAQPTKQVPEQSSTEVPSLKSLGLASAASCT